MSLVHRGCLLWFSCCQWSPHSLRRQPEDLSTTATTFPAADFMSQLGPLMSHQVSSSIVLECPYITLRCEAWMCSSLVLLRIVRVASRDAVTTE